MEPILQKNEVLTVTDGTRVIGVLRSIESIKQVVEEQNNSEIFKLQWESVKVNDLYKLTTVEIDDTMPDGNITVERTYLCQVTYLYD